MKTLFPLSAVLLFPFRDFQPLRQDVYKRQELKGVKGGGKGIKRELKADTAVLYK